MVDNKKVITNIEVQKRNKKRVNLYADGEFFFSCSTELVYSRGLKVGDLVNEEEIKSIAKEDNYLKCKDAALSIIERVYKSEKEIRDKLLLKGYDDECIIRVVDFLVKYNLIDDSRYASMYIKEKITTEGANKIKYALLRKGISETIINDKIAALNSEDVLDSAVKLAEKKYALLIKNESDERKIYKKVQDFLARKGYDWDVIKTVLNKVVKDNEID